MAVVGCGLIGSSVIRAAREAGACGEIVVAETSARPARGSSSWARRRVTGDAAEAVRDADLVVFAVPVLSMGDAARPPPPASSRAPRHRRGLGEGRGGRGAGRGLPGQRLRRPRPPDRRHRAVGPDAGFAELFQNRWTILTPDRDRRALPRRGRPARRLLDRASAPGSRRWTPATTTWCWPSPATCPT
jgi:cyclohexadieny/prephenate dehydrogenase